MIKHFYYELKKLPKGRQKALAGRIWPATRTLVTPASISHFISGFFLTIQLRQVLGNSILLVHFNVLNRRHCPTFPSTPNHPGPKARVKPALNPPLLTRPPHPALTRPRVLGPRSEIAKGQRLDQA